MKNKWNMTSFQELSNESFLLLSQCEHLLRHSDSYKWNLLFSSDTAGRKLSKEEEKAKKVLSPFIGKLGNRIDSILPDCGYKCSVVVYFMPGTWAPLPVFVPTSQFHISDAEINWKKMIKIKAMEISDDLRHSGMPKAKIDLSNTPQTHVFFFAHQYVDVLSQVCSKGMKVDECLSISTNSIGNCGLSVWIDLKKPDNTHYKLPIKSHGKSHGDISWLSGIKVPLPENFLLISPIFLNEDTLVLMASYFDRDKLKKAIGPPDDMKIVLGVHESMAQQVFGPLYTAMLRSDMSRLRVNLNRTNISSAVLDCAAKYLSPSNNGDTSGFTYAWEDDEGNEHYSNDFRWHIYGDIINHPDSIFKHVLFLEQSVYKSIQQSSLWKSIPSNINAMALPSTMPLSHILRAVEELARDLGTKDRDHILHQFQVFVFGTLIIKTEASNFFQAFAQSLKKYCDIGDSTKDDGCLGKHDERLILLLKSAWFLVSTCHDAGRPVKMVDDVIISLRDKIGELVRLDSVAIGELPTFRVDSILYDDPRTYLLLRELATAMATWLDKPEHIEDWWFFFRYMALKNKNHAFVSALSLGLVLTDKLQRHEFALLFRNDNFGRFIASQILIPIVLHHAYDWNEDLKNLKEEVKDAPEMKKKNVEGTVKTIKNFLKPHKNKPRVHFKQFPMAVLLAVTDYLQEDGRPSGKKEEYWPTVTLPDYQMWFKDGQLNLSYKSNLQYPNHPPGADEKTINDFRSSQDEDVEKKHHRSNQVTGIFDIKALKHLFLEVTYTRHGHDTYIFNHKGHSFKNEQLREKN